ncbi:MAG: 3-dehydroquinate synthase family protein [Spirochaetales bacterium]
MEFSLGQYCTKVRFSSGLPSMQIEGSWLCVEDTHTATLFPQEIKRTLVLPAGEQAKQWEQVEQILSCALDLGLDRSSIFVGIGGGVVCDVTAFAASLYMRGTRLLLVPTTLLAMVDAAFGGKTGINFKQYKNMVGTFYPAEEIWIYPEVLKTLPERELRSGMAEVVKAGMLKDPELFSLLEGLGEHWIHQISTDMFLSIISKALKVKGWFVSNDLREQADRAFLNLGHTFAHSLERATHYKRFTHGEAVAWGLFRALDTGEHLGVTNPTYAERVRKLLRRLGFSEKVEGVGVEVLLAGMEKDKKKRGELRFVLQKNLGETFLTSLDKKLLKEIIQIGII